VTVSPTALSSHGMDRCANCGAELVPQKEGTEREPCPNCGALAREIALATSIVSKSTVSASLDVERGVNESRMAAFALIFTTGVAAGLAVGFAAASVMLGVVAALVAAALTAGLVALVHRVRWVRHLVMELMHRLTGQ